MLRTVMGSMTPWVTMDATIAGSVLNRGLSSSTKKLSVTPSEVSMPAMRRFFGDSVGSLVMLIVFVFLALPGLSTRVSGALSREPPKSWAVSPLLVRGEFARVDEKDRGHR